MSLAEFRIGDHTKQVRGLTYKKELALGKPASGYVPVLRANNINESFQITYEDLIYLPEEIIKEEQFLRSGDILIVASSGSINVIGRGGLFTGKQRCSFGAFCKVVRPFSKHVLSGYIAHYFQSQRYRREIANLAIGANILNIKNRDINNLTLSAPENLTTQHEIVAALDKAKRLIDIGEEMIRLLDKLLRDSFLMRFQNHLLRSENLKPLESYIVKGPHNGLYKHASEYGSGTQILRIDSFYDGEIKNVDALKRVNLLDKEIQQFSLRENDIIINRVNSREFLGKSTIIPKLEEPLVYESNMMKITVDDSLILPKFLIFVLQQHFVKAQILKKAKDAVNQSSINQKDVKGILIPDIALDLQKSFVILFSSVNRIKTKRRNLLETTKELFNCLLQRAFHGDLTIDSDLQLDGYLEKENFEAVAADAVLIQTLIDRINQAKTDALSDEKEEAIVDEESKSFNFESEAAYNRAKDALFHLLKEGLVTQETSDKEDYSIKTRLTTA